MVKVTPGLCDRPGPEPDLPPGPSHKVKHLHFFLLKGKCFWGKSEWNGRLHEEGQFAICRSRKSHDLGPAIQIVSQMIFQLTPDTKIAQ